MNRRQIFPLIFVVSAVCLFLPNSAATEHQVADSIDSLIKVWKANEYAFPSRVKRTTHYVDATGANGEYFQEFKASDQCALFISARPKGVLAQGWNKDYWFEAFQPEHSKIWSLSTVGKMPLPPKLVTIQYIIESEMRQGLYYRNYSLLDMFSDPGLTVKKMYSDPKDPNLIGIQFQFTPSHNLEKIPGVTSSNGTIWLSKADRHLISKIHDDQYEFDMQDYASSGKICCVPNLCKQRFLVAGGEEMHLNEVSFSKIDLAEFRLPAFGLIEPEFLIDSRWPTTVTWILIAFLIFFVLIIFRKSLT